MCAAAHGRNCDGALGRKRGAYAEIFRNPLRYHSIVRVSPSMKLVFARKPNAFSARLVSRQRRGCPLGLLVSQTIRPSKTVNLAMISARFLMLISQELPRL